MIKNLDRLNKEELFQLLSQKVDTETARTFFTNKMSGVHVMDLTDDELMLLVPLFGPRKDVQKIITNFKRAVTAQTKVWYNTYCMPFTFCDMQFKDETIEYEIVGAEKGFGHFALVCGLFCSLEQVYCKELVEAV